MKKILEGSRAIAETIKLCRPGVIAVYPITPQTHIMEGLAEMKADNLANFEFIRAESEFAAISTILGASATGTRVYTASASQGILLMTEVLYNIAGMRLPTVMTCANRAVSAPISIWNDHQDAMILRDSGWIMLFAEDNQEACDLHIQAYKIAETVQMPAMVCMDGLILTHTSEPISLRKQNLVDKFLPKYKPAPGQYLDPKNPITIGGLSTPDTYMSTREAIHRDILAAKKNILSVHQEFNKLFGEKQNGNGLIEYYGPKNPQIIITAMGSVIGTIRHTLKDNPALAKKIGILKIKSFRPFPGEEISKLILKIKPKNIAVLDRAISFGQGGILSEEIKNTCPTKKVSSFVVGLGGKDITPETILEIAKKGLVGRGCATEFIY